MIVLEGVDATGKSTLAKIIGDYFTWPVIHSEGPEKYPGEIEYRLKNRYIRTDAVIYDRHPAVSQTIYGRFRQNSEVIPEDYIRYFYSLKPYFIFCTGDPQKHEIKAHDTEEHLESLKRSSNEISILYGAWALEHANLMYRIGDDEQAICYYLHHLTNKETK